MFTYGGKTFRTKGALKKHLSEAIGYKTRVIDKEFFDDVLADLFADRSYRFNGLRPTSFKYIRNAPGGDRPYSDSLAANVPGEGWHRFSKDTLLETDVSFDTKFERYCRERFATVWRPLLFKPGPCSTPGCSEFGTDLDHIDPQHLDIVRQCAVLITDDLRASWSRWVNARDGSHFVLPSNHPATMRYDDLTRTGSFQQLCKPHHAKLSGKRASGHHTASAVQVAATPASPMFTDPAIDDLFRWWDPLESTCRHASLSIL